MSPEAQALIKFLTKPENKGLVDSTTLGTPAIYNHYLENRLRRAFEAGVEAGKIIERAQRLEGKP